MSPSPPSILDVMDAFRTWFGAASWAAWRALLAALFGLPLAEDQLGVFRRHTGRTTPLTIQSPEAFLIIGRRGGKSIIAALVAVFLACFRSYRGILAPGERGVMMVLAADHRQARVVFRYIMGFLTFIPTLKQLVQRQTAEAIDLTNGITLEVHTRSFVAVRGYTVVGAICDELAFWRSEDSANPDVGVLAALRPAMLTVPGALLLCISTPYARRGALWAAYKDHYGRDGDPVFVWRADTRTMNPTVDERVIAAAYEQDEAAASAEYGAEFRRDLEAYVAREAVEAVVIPGRRELPPAAGLAYVAFADPSGGAADSMTLAIAHREADGRAVLDLVRERRPPFSPESVVREFAETLRAYGVVQLTGDRYGGEWPRERFSVYGVSYHVADKAKSDLYRDLLPLLNSGRVELLDEPRLVAQFLGLERRTARGGRDTIDHAPQGHDDVVNSAAGALLLAARGAVDVTIHILGGTPQTDAEDRAAANADERRLAIFGGDDSLWTRFS